MAGPPAEARQIFAGRLLLTSGAMLVGDLTSSLQREFVTESGSIQLEVYVDAPGAAERVDLLIVE